MAERYDRLDQFAEVYEKNMILLNNIYIKFYDDSQDSAEIVEVLRDGATAAEKLSSYYCCEINFDPDRERQYKDKIAKVFDFITDEISTIL